MDDSVSSGSVVGSTDETATATDTTTTTDTVTGTTAVTDTDVTATAGTTAGTDDTSVTTDTSTGTDTGTDTDTSTINISVAIPARNPLFGSSSDVSGDDSSPSDLIGTKLLALSGSDTGSSSDSATNNNDNNNDNNNNTNDTTGEGGEVVSTNIDGFGFSADTATSDTVATADTSTDASVTSPSTDYLFSVQISSRRTEEAARLSWEKISSRFVYILGGLTPDIRPTEIEGRGIFYRVRIPAETREAAINLCTQLKNAGGDCFVVR